MGENKRAGVSRRRVLGGMGAGVAAGSLAAVPALSIVATPAQAGAPARGLGVPRDSANFGRLFPEMAPFAEATDTVRSALLEVGMPGGVLDAGDDLAAGPTRLIVDPTVNGNPTPSDPYGSNPDNPTMTAGSTFVGQFVDHDITFDQTSQLGVPQNPLLSPNTRTPALDLDSVFGGGPGTRPDLYEPNHDGSVGPKLRLGTGGVHEDVPRKPNGDGTYTALLGDPRNDENLVIAGLHNAHILFYNRVLDDLAELDLHAFPSAASDGRPRLAYLRYRIAREVTVWHYQWLLVNEHLPQICGQSVVDDVLARGGQFFRPPHGKPFLPIEFGAAAYRFGHSMVRPSYRANFTSGTGDSTSPTANPFFALVFDANEPGFNAPVNHDRADLLGGFPAPRRYIGWQTFFDFGDGQVKNNKKIDTTISSVMFTLPLGAIAPHTQTAPLVLAQRNLLRQLTWGLPAGQSIAAAMGVDVLHPNDLGDIASVYGPFGTSTPLWYYVLAEAKHANGGLTLGPVGGRIVAETLIGLLRADPNSYLSVYPRFRPFLGTDLVLGATPNRAITGNRAYTRAHFLYYAGVVKPGLYR